MRRCFRGAVASDHNPTHFGEQQFGRHGDIKAENILWYRAGARAQSERRGILVLSDLGLDALNTEKSRSMQPDVSVRATPSYRPPECDVENGRVSRAFDIWTLGCLYLELMCWVLRGHDGKLRFDSECTTTFIYGAKTDIFFDIKRTGQSDDDSVVVQVRDEVMKEIKALHADARCTDWMHDLLDMVEQDMLLVNPKKRTSNFLLSKLRSMDTRCQTDEGYCLKHVSRPPKGKNQTGMLAQLNNVAKENIEHTINNLRVHKEDDNPLGKMEKLTLTPQLPST